MRTDQLFIALIITIINLDNFYATVVTTTMSLSKEDFLAFMSQQQSNREHEIERITSRVKETVREEVHSAVSSIVDRQDLLENKQKSFEIEQTSLKSRVSEIETALSDLKRNPPVTTTNLSNPEPTCPPARNTVRNDPSRVAERIISNSKAKNIVGFAPIDRDDLDRLKASRNLASDAEAMKAAFFEFADGEMKVPEHILSNLSIKRIFTPKNPSTHRLYVEFLDQITADLIWSYSRNLQSGMKVKLWVPPQFHDRFNAIDRHAYGLRTGSEKFRTSIKYGTSDFSYMTKPLVGGYWSDVSLYSFPPIDFSIGSAPASSSPPKGRQRKESHKRPRSPERDERASKNAKNDNDDIATNDADNLATNDAEDIAKNYAEELSKIDATVPGSGSSPRFRPGNIIPDLGKFLPSACLSPKSPSVNRDFTFGSRPTPAFPNLKLAGDLN